MDFDSYDVQILVAVGKACKPNSPKPERAWTRVRPLSGVPEFGDALSRLIRQGLLQRKHGYRVKPSTAGYEVIAQYKMHRLELKRRPVLFSQICWEPRMMDFKMAA
jgi:hypothetical protein